MNKLRIILSLGLLCYLGNVFADDAPQTAISQAQQMLEQSAAQAKANLVKSFPPPVVTAPVAGTQGKTVIPPPPSNESVPPPPAPAAQSSSNYNQTIPAPPPLPQPEAVAVTPGANTATSNDSATPNIYSSGTNSTDASTGSTDTTSSSSNMYK